jgi:hypothetical protein
MSFNPIFIIKIPLFRFVNECGRTMFPRASR